jgi:hypothetical protein
VVEPVFVPPDAGVLGVAGVAGGVVVVPAGVLAEGTGVALGLAVVPLAPLAPAAPPALAEVPGLLPEPPPHDPRHTATSNPAQLSKRRR